jgi:2-polyprenyl-3-methyl-5-hydroxy-6-metoxy-1,4-benzoquinol methylase
LTVKAPVDAALREGHYAAKQIFSKDRFVAYSHRRRFEVGVALAQRFRGRRILDYGCGDGTFISLLSATAGRPATAIGAEIDEFQVMDCRTRLSHLPGVGFDSTASLDEAAHQGSYDGVVCMEVLEHVVALDNVIDRLWRLLAHDGTLLVSVPVETGVPLLLKQLGRRMASLRGVDAYRGSSSYTLGEYVASVFAGSAQHMERPIYNADGDMPFHDHKGFNWRVLRQRLARRFVIDDTVASPIPRLGPNLATQVWFVAHKKPV